MNSIRQLHTGQRRRKIGIDERLTPCQFCGHPISQKHHALPVSIFGENKFTLQLCANCHELYHIVQDSFLGGGGERTQKTLDALISHFGKDDIRIQKACHFISSAINIASGVKNG